MVFLRKIREVVQSVLPIVLVVLLLHLTLVPLEGPLLLRFLLGSSSLIVGLTFFLHGVDRGIEPLGAYLGAYLGKSRSHIKVVGIVFLLGFMISVAEPGLLVLAGQVSLVSQGLLNQWLILLAVSLGLAILLVLGFYRILYKTPLYKLLLIIYLLIGLMAIFASPELLAISFDASGATTGILAVPFILSLSSGLSRLSSDSKGAEKDSFGLVSLASTGAILAVLILEMLTANVVFDGSIDLSQDNLTTSIWLAFSSQLTTVLKDSFLSLSPLFFLLIWSYKGSIRVPKSQLIRMLIGFVFALIGMVFFFLGANVGFMPVGTHLGQILVNNYPWFMVVIGFVLGFVTILAEPAVHVLVRQVQEVTSGYLHKRMISWTLASGVGLALALSVLRIIVPSIQLWHYLLPGYLLALGLMFVTPKLFVGIAFDAGGVATGPITATFILAFIQGAANAFDGAHLLIEGFGMIAMVALMPIITLELLGLVFRYKAEQKEKGA